MRLIGFTLVVMAGCATQTPLEKAFKEQGFTVQRGEVSSFLVEDCEFLTTCFGNNATTPYFLVNLPSYPKRPETRPLSTIGDIPKVPNDMSASYRLAPNEALVLRGRTPTTDQVFLDSPHMCTAEPTQPEHPFKSLPASRTPLIKPKSKRMEPMPLMQRLQSSIRQTVTR